MGKSVLAVSWLVFTGLLLSQVAAQTDGDNYRLPNNSYPLRYDVDLTTHVHDNGNERQFKFEGIVTIKVHVQDVGNRSITVNYRRTNITHVKLWTLSGNNTEHVLIDDNSSFVLDTAREFLTVHAPEPMNGVYYLEYRYEGELREDNAGFYRSSYVDDEGNTRWLATTQFSSTDARHAFPCYDEPGIRAPIGLRVTHGNQYTVLSNNLPKQTVVSTRQGYLTTIFEDTPRMQSYLLGIVVSDFVAVSKAQYSRQAAFARNNSIQNGEANFILEVGDKILSTLEEFLTIPYALPKIYQVAVPDFAAGAMENYGLVTYKEENFFYNPTTSPLKQKKRIATIVGHEFGHQYFGNYVSPAWWSFLWMKEGFARYFEYLASDMAYPEFDIDQTYPIDKMHNAFELDSLETVRPMTHYVNTQADIANIFDDIAYDKGGAVLRMFHHAVGGDVFRKALIKYLRDNALGAASPDDFAAALQQAMGNGSRNAAALLRSWTEQSGYPILHVSRGPNNVITVHQERYLLKSLTTDERTWQLPYSFATARFPDFSETLPDGWLEGKNVSIRPSSRKNWTPRDWVVFNKRQTGYYRVNYDANLWDLITDALIRNVSTIDPLNRAQIIDDAMNNARSGRLSYPVPLRLFRYMDHEHHYVPWAAFDRNMKLLDRLFGGSQSYPLLRGHVLSFVGPVFQQMGLSTASSDSLHQRMAREIVVAWACRMGSQECLEQTAKIVEQSVRNSSVVVDVDLREPIYCNGLRTAGRDIFLAVWNKMMSSNDQAYRTELIYSLGCAESSEVLKWFLDTTINVNGGNYFGQERGRVLSAVYGNREFGMETALKFFEENMLKINEVYNKGNFGGRAISSAIFGMAKQISSENVNTLLTALIDKLFDAGLLRSADVQQAKEYSGENLQWVQNRAQTIEEWLTGQYPSTTTVSSSNPMDTTTRPTNTRPSSTARTTSARSTSTSSSTDFVVVTDADDDDSSCSRTTLSLAICVLVTAVFTVTA